MHVHQVQHRKLADLFHHQSELALCFTKSSDDNCSMIVFANMRETGTFIVPCLATNLNLSWLTRNFNFFSASATSIGSNISLDFCTTIIPSLQKILLLISSATKNSPPKAGEGIGEAVPCYLLFATASVQTGEFVLTLNYCKRKSISYMKHVFLIKSRSVQKWFPHQKHRKGDGGERLRDLL